MEDWFCILCSTMLFYIYVEFKKVDGSLLSHSVGNNYVFHKPCDISQSFSVVYGQSFEQCFLDCKHLSICDVLMFSHRTKQCALFDESVTNKTFVNSSSICLYIKADKTSGNGGLAQGPQCGPLEKFDNMKNLCVKSRCYSPGVIDHSLLLFSSTSIGMSARYKCKPRYFGKGIPRIVCQQNATWSFTTFSCMSTTCPDHISIENAEALESTPTKVGSKLKYTCKPGFYSLGIPEIYCQLNATWAPLNFSCTDKRCPPEMNIPGAYVYSTGQFIGATAHYECAKDYLASGYQEIRCLENTSWSLTNFTCEKLCPAPKSALNAELVAVEYTDNANLFRGGTQINYSCNFDYYGESNTATSICDSDGIWNPDRVLCCKNGTVSDGNRCFQSFPIHPETNFYDIDGICASYGLEFVSTTQYLYNILAVKDSNLAPGMLYRRTKRELQADLYNKCLSTYMNTSQLKDYDNVTYEETMQVIKQNGWADIKDTDTVNFCRRFLVNDWLEGEPNGGIAHQCIAIRPKNNFNYDDIDCYNFDNEILGFVCMYNPPNVAD